MRLRLGNKHISYFYLSASDMGLFLGLIKLILFAVVLGLPLHDLLVDLLLLLLQLLGLVVFLEGRKS